MSATDPTNLKVGLIGYGLGGRRFHAPLISATQQLTISGVVARSAESVAAVKEDHPEAEIFSSVEAMLASEVAPDVVVVASPNHLHVRHAALALEAECFTVVDKPLGVSRHEVEELLAHRSVSRLTVFQNRRWDAGWLTAKKVIAEGLLGQPRRLELRLERWRPLPKVGSWRERAAAVDGGGALLDYTPHMIDQSIDLFGRPVRVYAELSQLRPEIESEDEIFLAITHESGQISHLMVSSLIAEELPKIRVLGDKGSYSANSVDNQEQLLGKGEFDFSSPDWGLMEPPSVSSEGGAKVNYQPHMGSWQNFYLDVARWAAGGRGTSPAVDAPVNPQDSLLVTAVVDAARKSSKTQTAVAL